MHFPASQVLNANATTGAHLGEDLPLPHRKLPHEGDRTVVVFYRHNPVTMRGLSSSDRAYLVGLGFPLPPSEAEVEAHDERIERKHLDGDRKHTEAAEKRRLAAAYLAEAAALEARAASADADQAGRRLNPAISLETENFAGSGGFQGFDSYETTLAFEQTVRLGGKRRLSERAARADAVRTAAD